MLKKKTILKILLLITILVCTFLLMLGRNVNASDQWEVEEKKFFWWNDKVGDSYSGSYNGINWTATIITEDTLDGPGTVSLKITSLDENKKELILPDSIKISFNFLTNWNTYVYNVVELKNDALEGATGVESIKIGKNISKIGSTVFENCNSLSNITVESGNQNFSSANGVLYDLNKTTILKVPNAKDVEKFKIPEAVTKIGDYAFCKNSTQNISLTIPNTITSIGHYAFKEFQGLKEVIISDSVTELGDEVFRDCTNLANVKLPNNLTKLSFGTFLNCTNLTDIELPNSLTEIGSGTFAYCTNLTNVKLPESLTNIGQSTFAYCTKLENINLPDTIENIGLGAFAASGLTSIEIPLKTVSIGYLAFAECPNLKNVILSNSVTSIGANAFGGCNNNLVVYCYNCNEDYINNINANSTVIPAYILCEGIDEGDDKVADYVKVNKFSEGSCTELDLLTYIYGLPIKALGEASFKGNTNIRKITLPKTITSIGAEVFCGCTSLTSIVLPKSIDSIPNKAFYKCESLSKVVIKKGSNITSIGEEVFVGCPESLIVYHDGNNPTINEYAKNNSNFRIDDAAPTATVRYKINDKKSATIILSNIEDNLGGSEAEFFAISKSSTVEGVEETEWSAVTSETVSKEVFENERWYIYISDMVGNTKEYHVDVLGIDKTRPEISEQYEIKYSKYGATVTVNVKEETDGSGLMSYAFSQSSNEDDIEEWKSMVGDEAEIVDLLENNGTWYLYVKDNAGNVSKLKIEVDGIDNIAPTIGDVIIEPDPSGRKYVEVKVIVNEEKGGSGLDAYAIDLNESITDQTKWVNIEGNLESYEIEKIIEANGTYYIHVRDKFKNEVTESRNIDGIIDQIAPRIEFGERTNKKIEVKITDAFTGIAEGAVISYAWGTTKDEEPETYIPVELTYKAGDKEVAFEIEGQGQGIYYLWINIENLKDVEGNENKDGKICSDSYEFDTVAPTIINKEISNEQIKNEVTTIITITTSEQVEHIGTVKPIIEESTAAEGCVLTELTGEGTIWQLVLRAGTGNGEVSIVLPAGIFKDLAGNTLSEDYKINGIVIDNTAPILSENASLSDSIIKQGQESTFTFVSEEQLVLVEDKKDEITLTDGQLVGNIKEVKSEDGKTWTITVVGGIGDGAVKLKLPAGLFKDAVGNETGEIVYEGLIFDNTMPTIEIMDLNSTVINSSSTVIFTIRASETLKVNEGSIEIRAVDSTNTITGTVDVNTRIIDGREWEVKVTNCTGNGEAKLVVPANYFVDEAGNGSNFAEKEGLTVDNTAPIISNIGEVVLDETKEKATIEITLEQSEEGLEYLVSTSEQIESETENWIDVTTNPIKIEFTQNGKYYVYIKDSVGNIVKTENIIQIEGIDLIKLMVEIKEESKYEIVAEEKLYIVGISPNTTIDTAINNIETNGEIKVYKGTEEIIDKKTKIATGMTIKITKGTEEKEYTVIVIGDTTQDGKADMSDILQINKHRLNRVLLTGINLRAGDVNEDGKLDMSDILKINKYRLGKDTL